MSDWQRDSGADGATIDRYITGNDDEQSDETGTAYEKRPDGQTLYEHMAPVEPEPEGGSGYQSHDWCVVLDSLYDDREGRMGQLQTATFQGRRLTARPEPRDFRRDVILQLLSANAEPVEMALSWDAVKALCAAVEVWEQEHPTFGGIPGSAARN